MIANFIKTAFRDIRNNKLISSINIFGLAIGMTGSLLIFVYVLKELSFEKIHNQLDYIYRVSAEFGSGETTMKFAGAMHPLGPAAKETIPEVINAVRIHPDRSAKVSLEDQTFSEPNFFFSDPSFFEVFTVNILRGNKNSLSDPKAVLISQSAANKYFGNENPIGNVLKYNGDHELTIAGVFEDIPKSTQVYCDFVASFKGYEILYPNEMPWNSFGEDYVYLLLDNQYPTGKIKDKLDQLLIANTSEQFLSIIGLHVLPLGDIYFNTDFRSEIGPSGNLNYIYLFSSIALLVLIIACLNFINLSTARSFYRSREVGIRKVLGAGRKQLIVQFIIESLLMAFFGLIFSLILFEIVFPQLNLFLNSKIDTNHLGSVEFYLLIFVLFGFVGVVATVYPAVFLSKFNPAITIKGIIFKGKTTGISYRKVFVVSQFVISIFLFIGTIVVFQQISFMKNSDLGFKKENVLLLSFPLREENSHEKYTVLKSELLKSPEIQFVTGAYTVPGVNSKEQQTVRLKDAPKENFIMMRAVGVDYDYLETLGIELLEGRNFSEDFGTDKEDAIIINESAVRKLSLDKPIGNKVIRPSGTPNVPKYSEIVGVMKDFHIESLHNPIEPLFLYINYDRFYNIAVKFKGQDAQSSISYASSKFTEIFPDISFDYSFLKDTYEDLYISEKKILQIVLIFTIIAMIIACLGLFGLASFSSERKTQEIGIRKVLGASVQDIILMIMKEFFKLVLIAAVITIPISYYALNKWLNSFAYKIDIGILPYVISISLVVLISIFTISYQAIKASLANPVNTIRYE
ncbi:ABC transporter permease [Bacteroidota bacterium]